MERLTFKSNNPFTGEMQYYPKSVYDDKNTGEKMICLNKQTECNNKLGQLEDIEEELGIELILYFKIYKHCLKRKPIYYIKNNQIVKSSPRVECCLGSVAEYVGDYGADEYNFKDYGKTWALTKEELL